MSDYSTFYIVRHGETNWNAQHRIQGHTDTSLNENGINQAKKVSKELKNIKFDLAFASDLQRAHKTAQIIALEHELTVTAVKALRERYFSSLEGANITDEKVKQLDAQLENLSDEERVKHKFDSEMETDEQMISRFITFIRETAILNPGKTILIGTHGGIMQAFLIHIGYFTYKNVPYHSISNTAYIKLETDGVDFFIKETKGIKEPKG